MEKGAGQLAVYRRGMKSAVSDIKATQIEFEETGTIK
jgi:hypothetical protein